MAQIGKMLVMKNDKGKLHAKGNIRTMSVNLKFAVRPTDEMPSEKSPTHVLEFKTDDGFVQIGAAWQREMVRGSAAGQPMFSLAFSDPALPDFLANIAAFPTDEEDDAGVVYRIEFDRARRAAAQEVKEAA